MPTRFEATREDLADLLAGEPRYRVDQVWDGLYRRTLDPAAMTDLPMRLRTRLEDALPPSLTAAAEVASGGGETVKWVWRLRGGATIETVLMHYAKRSTVCVSSQAGCAMGCGFCATGQAGFNRNLEVGEIVEQVVRAARRTVETGRRLSNVVFMGMGEPMANYDRVEASLRRLQGELGLSARHLTVSTVGIVPGIRRLAASGMACNLAVSLHAANDALRDTLVPVNRHYPLDVLLAACAEHGAATGRRLSFEWALIDGVNDRPGDAVELAAHARRLRAHVNLIPLNPTPGWSTRGTPRAGVIRFRDHLLALGARATVRQNRGTSIDAACGQLRAVTIARGGRSAATGPGS
ncbi:MAG: 23S rRNA (adenine(2503)-C(2))-methyltransferase RlmN [Actinomycetota bacterium]|nr:23S rRNA (adenine(2503)-C(2))-methyltransferase RlmN [Actinomycetota bacterium]